MIDWLIDEIGLVLKNDARLLSKKGKKVDSQQLLYICCHSQRLCLVKIHQEDKGSLLIMKMPGKDNQNQVLQAVLSVKKTEVLQRILIKEKLPPKEIFQIKPMQ